MAVRTAIINENACNPILRASTRSVLTVNTRWVLALYVGMCIDSSVYLGSSDVYIGALGLRHSNSV